MKSTKRDKFRQPVEGTNKGKLAIRPRIRRGHSFMSPRCVLGVGLLVLGVVASACSSSPTTRQAHVSHGFEPNLSGQSISMFAGGDAPLPPDTNAYIASRILAAWGASVSYGTGAPATIGASAVLAGKTDIVRGPIAVSINSGLIAFAPGQPRVGSVLVGMGNITSIKDLPGHTFSYDSPTSSEAVEFDDLAKKYHLNVSRVHIITGIGYPDNVSAMIAGKVQSSIVEASAVPQLEKAGGHVIAVLSKALPNLYSSIFSASSTWLKDNPKLALAVCEADILATRYMYDNKTGWIQAADKYTGGTLPKSSLQSTYGELLKYGLYVNSPAAFTAAGLLANEDTAAATGGLKTSPPPPLAHWATTKYWLEAWNSQSKLTIPKLTFVPPST